MSLVLQYLLDMDILAMSGLLIKVTLMHTTSKIYDRKATDYQPNHYCYKELQDCVVMKPGKLQRNKQRSKDLSWKVHDDAQSFVLSSHTLAELRNCHVSIT